MDIGLCVFTDVLTSDEVSSPIFAYERERTQVSVRNASSEFFVATESSSSLECALWACEPIALTVRGGGNPSCHCERARCDVGQRGKLAGDSSRTANALEEDYDRSTWLTKSISAGSKQ